MTNYFTPLVNCLKPFFFYVKLFFSWWAYFLLEPSSNQPLWSGSLVKLVHYFLIYSVFEQLQGIVHLSMTIVSEGWVYVSILPLLIGVWQSDRRTPQRIFNLILGSLTLLQRNLSLYLQSSLQQLLTKN